MVTATAHAPGSPPAASAGSAPRALVLFAALSAVALAVALAVAAALAGSVAFPVHPAGLGALLLAGSALVLRPARSSAQGPAALVTATGSGLLAYALLGSAAAASASGAALPGAAWLLASLWGAAWLPPLVTTAAAGLVALPAGRRRGPGARARSALVVVLLVTGAATTAATAALQEPVEPFSGLPPAAPAAWSVAGGGLLDLLSLVLAAALLAAPSALAVAGARRRSAARAQALLLALGASAPTLVVVVCLLLAVARDPGGVDPSVGSTGFLVVLATGCWAGCAAARSATAPRPGAALLAVRCAAGAVVVTGVLAAGVLVAALLDGAPLLLLVGAVALLAAAGLEGWRRASGWAGALLEEEAARPRPADPADAAGPADAAAPVVAGAPTVPEEDGEGPELPARTRASTPAPAGWDDLTRREREVLAALARGASNAGIAAELGISPRTVEAHLRSVFTRLCLDPADGANRRVVAARLWLAHGDEEQVRA